MSALAPAELYGRHLEAPAELLLRDESGGVQAVPVSTWLGPPSAADCDVLGRAVAPVLDVGCGPGRHVLALAKRGLLAVGLDVAPDAVRIARRRGATVIETCVFDRVPGAGTWGSALLLDGNVGIGGRPDALLARVGSLLAPGGVVLAEVLPPGVVSGTRRVRLESGAAVSAWFPWAYVGAHGFSVHAARAGLRTQEIWEVDGRWFACAVR